jgi:hypothetical protein
VILGGYALYRIIKSALACVPTVAVIPVCSQNISYIDSFVACERKWLLNFVETILRCAIFLCAGYFPRCVLHPN